MDIVVEPLSMLEHRPVTASIEDDGARVLHASSGPLGVTPIGARVFASTNQKRRVRDAFQTLRTLHRRFPERLYETVKKTPSCRATPRQRIRGELWEQGDLRDRPRIMNQTLHSGARRLQRASFERRLGVLPSRFENCTLLVGRMKRRAAADNHETFDEMRIFKRKQGGNKSAIRTSNNMHARNAESLAKLDHLLKVEQWRPKRFKTDIGRESTTEKIRSEHRVVTGKLI